MHATTKATQNNYNIQLSILGDEKVGKSSVLQAISKHYEPNHDLGELLENIEEIRISLVNDKSSYFINIREQYYDMESYLSRVHLYSIGWVLAFDLTAITSMHSLEEYYNRYADIMVRRLVHSGWVPNYQHSVTDVLLIGTKADLATDNRLTKAQIEEFARSKSVHSLETPLQSNEALPATLNKMATSIVKGTLYHAVNTRHTRKKKRTRCVIM